MIVCASLREFWEQNSSTLRHPEISLFTLPHYSHYISAMKCPDSYKALYTPEEINKLVENLASEIDKQYSKLDEDLVCVGVLKGAWLFLADLVRKIERPTFIDFVWVSSYGSEKNSSGVVKIEKDVQTDVTGKHVLLVEEIIDSGRTLRELKNYFEAKGALSVKIVALLDKKECRVVDIEADFVGTEIKNHFVVGYGLDWNQRFRDLAGVHIVPEN